MPAETMDKARWQASIAHATAAGTVFWQQASLATGLISLASIAIRFSGAFPIFCLAGSVLQAMLLAAGLWLGLRLRIDAVLFRSLAEAESIDGFDQAMLDMGLLDSERAARPMPDRVAGLLRLVRSLGLVVVAQLMLLVATGWFAWG